MVRKDFLRGLSVAGMGWLLPERLLAAREDAALPIIPPYLKPGDTIAVTSPAGYITAAEIQPAITQLQSWGLTVKIGSTIGKRDGTLGGTDTERAADLQQLINDPNIQAILCARGGYGLIRIIDQVNFKPLRQFPKWMIGFSDVTVLHAHLSANLPMASVHSKMCNSFPDDWSKADPVQQASILSIRDMLFGQPMKFSIAAHPYNRSGRGTGILVGGNCKTLETLAGSKSDLNTRGKLLFLEDTGEYLYSIDRMFWNLKRSGKLDHLAGLIIGGFKHKPSENPAEEFGKNLVQIVMEKTADCAYPVCFDFPVGHQKNNFAVKCGALCELTVTSQGAQLNELNTAL